MTPLERLAEALIEADDIDPGFANDLAIDDDVAPEMARILTIADEHLAQDIADGQAMRQLREALPDGWKSVVILTPVVLPIGPDATIADAADACRKALEERS